jgi:acetolactate synthase I/II/III large subunit
MIRLSDYVIDRVALEGVDHIFMVSGGGGMFLIDSLGKSSKIKFVCNHHEQACSMAAEAYSRVTGNLGIALVTTGPAGTNAITGLMCAWTDSIPMLVISGQARSNYLIGNTGLRQRGFHEANITRIVESVTKYAVTVLNPNLIAYHLDKAIFLAKNGRCGPVWIDIPLDIQGAMIEPGKLVRFEPEQEFPELFGNKSIMEIDTAIQWLKQAKRPVILAGHGIKLAKCQTPFIKLVETMRVPVVTSRSAFDVIDFQHPLRAGFVGTYGQRAGNFTVQNSDLLISVGCRLAFTLVGYETHLFAREAKKIVVDIDEKQLEHALIKINLPIHADVKDFIAEFQKKVNRDTLPDYGSWLKKINHWKKIFPNVTSQMISQDKYVSSYYFYEVLSEEMSADNILVWDQGASYHCAAVAFKVKKEQKAFSNEGFTPMGYGLPAAVGACFANDQKQVVCVHGDGGLQLNVQELQTIYHHNLPIKLFVFNNHGYTSIKHTQTQYFDGHLVGSDPGSGLSCPNTLKLADGYGLPSIRIESHARMREIIHEVLNSPGPYVVDVVLDPFQPIEPRVKSERLPDGRMVSKPLEDMYPYLDREIFKQEMIIKPVDE